MRIELPILLAARLGQIVRVIFSTHHNCLSALDQAISNIGMKRGAPSFMLGDEPAVHPNGRAIIDCFEMEEKALASRGRRLGELPAIPARTVETGSAHPTCSYFGSERHLDIQSVRHFVGTRPLAFDIQRQLPATVQALPSGSLQLWSWKSIARPRRLNAHSGLQILGFANDFWRSIEPNADLVFPSPWLCRGGQGGG